MDLTRRDAWEVAEGAIGEGFGKTIECGARGPWRHARRGQVRNVSTHFSREFAEWARAGFSPPKSLCHRMQCVRLSGRNATTKRSPQGSEWYTRAMFAPSTFDQTGTPTESFHSHHSPLGAFSSFTVGLVGSPGGFGHALKGPAKQNVYVGFKRIADTSWRLLPFFTPHASNEAAFTGEAATPSHGASLLQLGPHEYSRTLGWASDTWRADDSRFEFALLSPFGVVDDPNDLKRRAARLALSPHLNGWIEYDNTSSTQDVELIFGIGDTENLFHPLGDAASKHPGFAMGTRFAYATHSSASAELRQGFDVFSPKYRDYRGLCVLGGESALIFRVKAGQKQRFPLVLAFFHEGTATTGIATQYAYTRYFDALEDVIQHGLKHRDHYERLAAERDQELRHSRLSEHQQFLLAQATHSYLGNTQLLWGKKGPLWIVNEGEYRMMNTFDLTVDHLFFELRWFPWAQRNTLDLFLKRYSYEDQVFARGYAPQPGGLSFTHDMGVNNHFTPAEHSAYECDHQSGCFSHMTMEQLLNFVICSTTYALYTKDHTWLGRRRKTLLACMESMHRRDNPNPSERNGLMKFDSLRCGPDGAEITTYDSLDISLGQARNNLYLGVKTLGAWLLLEAAFTSLELSSEATLAAHSADTLANTLSAQFDFNSQSFPAVFENYNTSRIIPAVEGLAYNLFLGLTAPLERNGRFSLLLSQLSQHLRSVLQPGICLDGISGAWKMSSTSNNTWFSKIALSQYVVRKLFPEALSEAARSGDEVHARWQRTPGCGAFAMCDQIRSDSGVTCGSRYYPRGVTAILWLSE
jgi:xylan 1,4-beta-xylosidase